MNPLNPIFDCIYTYLYDNMKEVGEPKTRCYHLIPHCRRPDINDTQEEINDFYINDNQIISFVDLNKQGITSEQLVKWMPPIRVAERYEKYGGNSQSFITMVWWKMPI